MNTSTHHTLLACCALNGVVIGAHQVMTVSIPSIFNDTNWPNTTAGAIWSSYLIGAVMSVFPTTVALQYRSHTLYFVLFAAAVWSSAWTMMRFAIQSGLAYFVVCRLFCGLTQGYIQASLVNTVGLISPETSRATNIGRFHAAGTAGEVIGHTATLVHWSHAFPMVGVSGFVACLLWYTSYSVSDTNLTNPSESPIQVAIRTASKWRRLLRSREMRALIVIVVAIYYRYYFYFSWSARYAVQEIGLPTSDLWVMIGFPAGYTASSSISGMVVDQFVRRGYNVWRVRRWTMFFAIVPPYFQALLAASVTYTKWGALLQFFIYGSLLGISNAGYGCSFADLMPQHSGVAFTIATTFAWGGSCFEGPLDTFLIGRYGWHAGWLWVNSLTLFGLIIYSLFCSATKLTDAEEVDDEKQ